MIQEWPASGRWKGRNRTLILSEGDGNHRMILEGLNSNLVNGLAFLVLRQAECYQLVRSG